VTATPDQPDGATWRAWGVDPSWSRLFDVRSHDGDTHRWHVLDTGPGTPGSANIVCVHGNPTWAYAWKSFLARFGDAHRVIAIDQLGMGYSERLDASHRPRRYRDRVADLGDVIDALDLDADAPLVLAAHDWGGAIAMGWAVQHTERVAGMVLCNTGIGVPEGRGAPKIIRLARSAPLRDLVCRRTPIFVEGTVRLSGRRISRTDRMAFRAPYRSADHRRAIADFVGDVPLVEPHPSADALLEVADRLSSIDAPVLLAWGSKDIVFDDDFAADLVGRFPNARLQRFPEANHLVMAEADVAGTVDVWLRDLLRTRCADTPAEQPAVPETPSVSTETASVFDGLRRRFDDHDTAIADLSSRETIDFKTFTQRVEAVAAGLRRRGLVDGDRVAMLTPPGIDLLVAVYGVWRAGGVTVIADRGLGLRGLGRAVASTRPKWTVGPRRAGLLRSVLRWAPRSQHIDVTALIAEPAGSVELPPEPTADDPAAILFTSGATGPAKGVRYRHGQLAAQGTALAATYEITASDRLVAAFAPFALYGPALGVPTALTDCDVTTPGKLTVQALDEACREIGATMAFASPAAMANVVATAATTPNPSASGKTDDGGAHAGLAGLRLVFSAGAPVPAETLHAVAALAPNASIRTPYGMTEALPVADIDLAAIDIAEAEGDGRGVCVGRPVDGAEVRIVPMNFDALDGVPAPMPSGETGEILVRAPWVSEGYLGRWETERLARPGDGWHRSGDVGHVDVDGRLWVEGRSVHVIDAAGGAITPVPVERAIERSLDPKGLVTAGRVAAVGVGPAGCQQLVVVIERSDDSPGLADRELASAVRAAVSDSVAEPVAAVLVSREVPVDIRHNAKIDRAAVAVWAADVLA
jgi:acyl-CoA synthetase (AMP-forming)/AMP-acid ligase II/pimeloyl-ACP methyl ester carboxylesterase